MVYIERKSKVVLAADIFSIIVCSIGLKGILEMSIKKMLLHSFLSTSVLGAFFVYCVFEAIFLDTEDSHTGGLDE